MGSSNQRGRKPNGRAQAAVALLEIRAQGNVRNTTLRAFDRSEIEGIMKKTG